MQTPMVPPPFPDWLIVKITALRLMLAHRSVTVHELRQYLRMRGYRTFQFQLDVVMDWLAEEEQWNCSRDRGEPVYWLSDVAEAVCPCEWLGFSAN